MDDQELIGDKIERLLKKVNADKVSKVYEQATKRPCKCKQRKEFMNAIHKKMQEMRDRVRQEQKTNAPN